VWVQNMEILTSDLVVHKVTNSVLGVKFVAAKIFVPALETDCNRPAANSPAVGAGNLCVVVTKLCSGLFSSMFASSSCK
jgi:hypothetical protein